MTEIRIGEDVIPIAKIVQHQTIHTPNGCYVLMVTWYPTPEQHKFSQMDCPSAEALYEEALQLSRARKGGDQ